MKYKIQWKWLITIIGLVLLGWGAGNIPQAQAISWTYNLAAGKNYTSIPNPFSFVGTAGLVTIEYNATARHMETGSILSDGAALPVGAHIKFEPTQYNNTDINYTMAGNYLATPYGFWTPDAESPIIRTDDSTYVIQNCTDLGPLFSTMTFNPPTTSLDTAGSSASLSCNSSYECTVNSPGTINAAIIFSPTYGYAWYAFDRGESQCFPSMATQTVNFNNPPLGGRVDIVNNADRIDVPQQAINFSFSAIETNGSPYMQQIIGPTEGDNNIFHSFSLTALDPDNDTIRYGIDLDMDTVVDQWVPAWNYVNSGTPQVFSKSWINPGTYTFQVQAQDEHGAVSGWLLHTIKINQKFISPPGEDAAHFISQSVFDGMKMTEGEKKMVSITLENCRPDGNCFNLNNWYFDPSTSGYSYKLVTGDLIQAGTNNWGISEIALTNDVSPGLGRTYTFNFEIVAPTTAGPYHFQWGMYDSYSGVFQEFTPDIVINVEPPCTSNCEGPSVQCIDFHILRSCVDEGGGCFRMSDFDCGSLGCNPDTRLCNVPPPVCTCGPAADRVLYSLPDPGTLCNGTGCNLKGGTLESGNPWKWTCVNETSSIDCQNKREVNWKEVIP